jgi:hypothetical protein
MVIFKDYTMIWVTCTHHISILKKICNLQKCLSLSKNWRKTFLVRGLNYIALFGPLKQICPYMNNFYRFLALYNKPGGTNSLLGEMSNSIPINF